MAPYGTRILVAGLVKGGPAATAGLQEMDEIVSADGVVLKNEAELTAYVGPRGRESGGPGDTEEPGPDDGPTSHRN